MAAIPVFDCSKWSIKNSSLSPAPRTFSAGRGIGGNRQIRRVPNNYWRGSFTLNRIYGRDMIDWRGFIGALEGSSGVFDMCLCEPYSIKDKAYTHEEWLAALGLNPANLCGPVNGRYFIPFSDGTCFSDNTGFQITDYVAPAVTANAAIGATEIELNSAAYYLKRGHRFSTQSNFLYQISCIEGTTATITPPLREALTAGDALQHGNPKIRVRLSNDEGGSAPENYGRWTDEVSFNVEEVFER